MAKAALGIAAFVASAAAAVAQTAQGEVRLAPLNVALSGSASAAPAVPTIEKGDRVAVSVTAEVTPAAPRLTPRGMGVTLYPQPSVAVEGGIVGPYGQGLAAAAPVGTPYLRSPAFAGPPIIYMPQTVTRVLLPGVTPYPANVMYPPQRYVYSSAPFLRTDIYVNLPYGTFYWPQGYAGTTPVEPQVPAYALAPSTAIYTNEASYSTQRYAPGLASAETIDPLAIATPAASTEVVVRESDTTLMSPSSSAAPLTLPSVTEIAPTSAPSEPPPSLQPLQPFPSASTTIEAAPAAPLATPTPAASGPPPGMPPLPSAGAPSGMPPLPGSAPSSGMPPLPGSAPSSGMPPLPGASAPSDSALPSLPGAPAPDSGGLPTLPALPGAPAPANP